MSAVTAQQKLDDSVNPTDRTPLALIAARVWASFARQIQFDAKLWLLGVVLLQLFRMILIATFRDQLLGTNRVEDFLTVFVVGLRYDAQVAVWFALPGLLASVGCLFLVPERVPEGVRCLCRIALIVACVVVGVVDLGFFREFHDQFNHFAFLALTDDVRAVLLTIWKQHPVVWELLGLAAILGTLIPLSRRWVTHDVLGRAGSTWLTRTWIRRACFLGITLLLVVFCWRGKPSLYGRTLHVKDSAVTKDRVLNQMVMNPFSAIRFAIERKRELSGTHGLEVYLADNNVACAARTIAKRAEPIHSVDDALHRIAKGPKGVPPKHVFFILMESYDAWPTLERYRSLGLTERLMDLGRRGIFTRKFLSAGDYTIKTFSTLVTGLTDAGVATNYQPSSQKQYPSSISPIFRRLELRTRMFMGGYPTWQRCDGFCLDQGFQEFYAAPHMVRWLQGNEWGPDDRELFDFVLRAVDPRKPSFNFILTSSFHPPYSVDVFGRGFPHKELPADLKSISTASREELRVVGHLWYADQMLGEFVETAEKRFPGSLFVITGDHTPRKFLNGHPTLYERSAVPFVMYGPDVLKGIDVPSDLVGSHHDIMPTLFELLAPRGFEYHALGHDLLDPNRPQFGFGSEQIIGRNFIATRHSGGACEPLPDRKLPNDLSELPRLQTEYQAMLGVAWWRICRGSEFPDQESKSTNGAAATEWARQPHSATAVR